MKTLVIIPAYNEAKSIENVILKLQADAPEVDYVIINDCSKDDTISICKKQGFNVVDLPINLGIGGGVQTGYLYAVEHHYDIAIQIDGDGQHDTSYIREVIKPIEANEADIVIGSRFITKEGFQSSSLRRFGINFLSRLIKLCCQADVKDVTSGFRAVNRKYMQLYANDYAQDYPEPEAIIAAALRKARIKEVPVIMKERENGQSSIQSIQSIYYMLKVSLAILLYRLTNHRED